MAGLDYSNVVEPDFNISKITQPKDITNYIKEMSDYILDIWKNKEEIKKKTYEKKDVYTFDRNIYYDTSNISEQQTRKFYRCDNCQGIDTIESKNNLRDYIYAITIPIDSCEECLVKVKNFMKMLHQTNILKCFYEIKKKTSI